MLTREQHPDQGRLWPNPCTHGYAHRRRNCPTCVERDRLLRILSAANKLLAKADKPCESGDEADHIHWLDGEVARLRKAVGGLWC